MSNMDAPAVARVGEKDVEMGENIKDKNGQEGDERGPSHAIIGRISWKRIIWVWVIYILEGIMMGAV